MSSDAEYIRTRLYRRLSRQLPIEFEGKWRDPSPHFSAHKIYAVYPLYRLLLIPTFECYRMWQESRTLAMPNICCVCGADPYRNVDYYGYSVFARLRKTPLVRAIPHCREHYLAAGGNALIHVDVREGNPRTSSLYIYVLYSISREFSLAALKQAESLQPVPPWKLFSWDDPVLARHSQGAQEEAVSVWFTFFERLNVEDQDKYLNEINASPSWRDWARRKRMGS